VESRRYGEAVALYQTLRSRRASSEIHEATGHDLRRPRGRICPQDAGYCLFCVGWLLVGTPVSRCDSLDEPGLVGSIVVVNEFTSHELASRYCEESAVMA
jgi:hypothetical protein